MNDMDIWRRNIPGRGKANGKYKGTGGKSNLVCLTASRKGMCVEKNEKQNIKRWGQRVEGGADCNDLDFYSE